MPAKPLGDRLSFHGKALLRNDHWIDNWPLSLLAHQRSLEPIQLQPNIDHRNNNWTFYLPAFFGLPNILYKGVIMLLLQSIIQKNLLSTFEQSTNL